MENIIILTVDSPFKPIGGLGVSIKEMVSNIPEYNFISFGKGDDGSKDNLTHYRICEDADDGLLETYKSKVKEQLEIIKKHIEGKKIKVIHIFDWQFSDLGIALAKYLNIKWIFTFALSAVKQFDDLYNFFKYIYPDEADRMKTRNTSRYISCSQQENVILDGASDIIFVSEYYKSLYPSKYDYKYNVILNGIDFKQAECSPEAVVGDTVGVPVERHSIPGRKDTIKVLYIGRLAMMKNITFLLETEVPDGIELIIAAGPDAGMTWLYEKLKRGETPKNVHFVDFISGEKKKFFLQNVDAVIVPSIHEPFGIVVLEAVANKRLVITSRMSGMREIVDENSCICCGLIPFTIKEAYMALLNSTKEQRDIVIDNAYKSIQHLTWKNNAIQYKKIYDKY
jgi:glycosyltransferase involved in cell wall biosynthesis